MGDFAKDINSSFPNNKVKALLNIIYTSNWITSHQNEYFKPFGISPQQYNILRILKGAGTELKVQVIKERMIERAPNATRLMDKLCTKELITRHNCKNDRRVVYVEITIKGIQLLDAIAAKNIDDLLNNLSENEAKILSDLLDKIR
ncbi:MAG: MarR family transcriptional regulator [Flavobacteriaceae bacterium]